MKKIIITRGIPASGKSTWAIKFVSENPDYIRVSRDDFRTMLNNYQWSNEIEKLVNKMRNDTIISSLKSGYNVVIDETSCSKDSFKQLISLLSKHKIECEVSEKYFYSTLEKSFERNSLRERKVPEDIIRKMYKFCSDENYIPKHQVLKYNNSIDYDFSQLHNESLQKAILVDIDGTVSLFNCREKVRKHPKAHYRNAYDASKANEDYPNIQVFEALKLFNNQGYKIIFASGREEKFKSQTIEFLNKHLDSSISYELFMRKYKDQRSDVLIKKDILIENILNKYYVYVVFDDRNIIVDFYRDLGLNVWQVNDGNF